MAHYRFYFMIGTMIMQGEDVTCSGDDDAMAMAMERLGATASSCEAIEVWQGTRQVCRHERTAAPQHRG
jgi:hypothetical protein